jgi:hypothetical protein
MSGAFDLWERSLWLGDCMTVRCPHRVKEGGRICPEPERISWSVRETILVTSRATQPCPVEKNASVKVVEGGAFLPRQ